MASLFHSRSLTVLAALVAAGGAVSLGAQPPRPTRLPPRPDTPRFVVQIFGSTDRIAGPSAANDLRDRLIRAFPSRTLYVVPPEEQFPMLEQSGFPKDQQLSVADEAALAKILRADDFIRGAVTKEGDLYRVNASLVLTRDPALSQPLPTMTGNRPDRAAAGLVEEIKQARKQLVNEKRCRDLARDEKLDEAVKAADAAVVEYPRATLVRYCKLNVLYRRKAPNTQIIAMADEILAIDPNAKAALQVAAEAHKAEGHVDKANELLVRLLALEPTNAKLASDVVDALAASGNYTIAKEIVLKAVQDNPGDVALVSLQFRILAAARDFKAALVTGEEMIQMDTSLADLSFFNRLIALYAADSQPQKSAEAAARATRKFADNAQLWQTYSQTLKAAGQLQQSIGAAKRALEINPKIPNGWTQVAIAYNDLNFPDSALIALHLARDAGDDVNNVGGYAVTLGNKFYRAAMAEEPKKIASLEAPFPYLHFADSTLADPAQKSSANFLIGVTSYYVAATLAEGLQKSKSCDESKRAQAAVIDAQLFTQRGARTSPQNAATVLTAAGQLQPYLDDQVKRNCK